MFGIGLKLNSAQREAMTCGDGPVLVVAGAGTGKTWTLACRVAYLIDQGVPAERILLLTFSRRAAREMLQRAGDHATRVWGGTFHATANRLLRLYGRAIGVQPDFTILDQADLADLLDLVREQLEFDRQRKSRFPRKDTLADIYSRTINASQGLSSVLDRHFPWCTDQVDGIRAIFEQATRRKREQNVLDYDDLLLFWKALAASPAGKEVADRFDHVLVDEYQDTNPLQAEILLHLRQAKNRNLMVVGDDSQAIYGFRSASASNMLDFPRQFPGTRIITLEQNYRSTTPILGVSNAVIAGARERYAKELRSVRAGGMRPVLLTCADEAEQALRVCEHALEHREQGTPLHAQAVLFRSSHHSDVLELELARRNIPFVKYGGLKFLEGAHVKDVLALLRVLENPRDEVSWFRVLQLLDGVGPAGARSIISAIGVRDLASASPVRRLVDHPPAVPPATFEPLEKLRAALADCLDACAPPAVEVARLRRFYEPIVEQRYTSPASRLHDLEQLEHLASASPTRGRFLADLTLDPPSSTSDLAGPPLLDEDYLVLSTIHSAKGGEWDVVHVIGAADGMIPSDLATGDQHAIEEERRLLYVALTRARDALYVTFPLRFYARPRGLDDAHHFGQVSRFLTPEVQRLFDTRVPSAEPEEPEQPLTAVSPRAAERVDAYLHSLWSG
jgi:DNA helicase II / ATP-dependent DNA helicase PcrA